MVDNEAVAAKWPFQDAENAAGLAPGLFQGAKKRVDNEAVAAKWPFQDAENAAKLAPSLFQGAKKCGRGQGDCRMRGMSLYPGQYEREIAKECQLDRPVAQEPVSL